MQSNNVFRALRDVMPQITVNSTNIGLTLATPVVLDRRSCLYHHAAYILLILGVTIAIPVGLLSGVAVPVSVLAEYGNTAGNMAVAAFSFGGGVGSAAGETVAISSQLQFCMCFCPLDWTVLRAC